MVRSFSKPRTASSSTSNHIPVYRSDVSELYIEPIYRARDRDVSNRPGGRSYSTRVVTGPEVQERPAPYAEHELGGDLFAGDEQGRFRWQRRLSGVLRERRWLRRLLQLLAVMAFLAGALVFAFPFITNIGADRRQGQLQREFAEPATRSAYVSNSIGRGHALTRIQIPKLGVDSIVVEGTSLKDLEAGAGHYEGTALP